ncbi:MAG: hypothetical protein QM536_03245 [Chitinophagaceae bacterium]|nr:hypothetical protein [Chitinophagaceae bacterium]
MIDYRIHKAFLKPNYSFELSQEDIQNFETLYKVIKIEGFRLKRKLKEKIKSECFGELEKIKLILLKQKKIERDGYFITDLFNEINFLLENDIKFYFLETKTFLKTQQEKSLYDKYIFLKENLYYVSKIEKRAVEEILKVGQPAIEVFKQNVREGKTTRDDLSINNGDIVQKIADVVNKQFEYLKMNELMSMYTGREMHVGGLALELSVPKSTWWNVKYDNYDLPAKTTYFHYDESPAYPKSILYLSDVTKDNGPTSVSIPHLSDLKLTALGYLVGRIIGQVGRGDLFKEKNFYQHNYHQIFSCPIFREDFMKLPNFMQWNSHFGWDLIPGSSEEKYVLQNEKHILGEAGTFLVFDGANVLHRGGLLNSGERIALQVIFSEKPTKKVFIRRRLGKLKRLVFNSIGIKK